MKTVFITSFHILIGRNVLATDFMRRLTARDVRIVVLVPGYKKEYFETHFGGPGVVIEGIAAYPFSRTLRGLFFKRLARPLAGTRTSSIRIRQKLVVEKKFFYYFLFLLPARLLLVSAFAARCVRWLDAMLAPHRDFFAGLIERYRPDLIITADINNENDVALIQEARRRGIRTLGLIRSWDGPTNFLIRAVPDHIAVWNEILRDELLRYQRIGSASIAVIGIPHYDRYAKGPTLSREAFFRQLGIDSSRRLILYVPVADFRLPDNDVDAHVLDILSGLDAALLARLPPAATEHLDRSAYPLHVIFQESGLAFRGKGDSELTVDDDERLLNALSWCDVVVSGPGTINIDAAFFDKPNVLVNFFPTPKGFFEGIIEYEYDHIKNILRTGGARVAHSREELVRSVEAYLRDPSLDREGRERIRQEQCFRMDGASADRLARLAASLLQRHGQSRAQ